MTARQENRGGAPVGYLYELAPVEAMAVLFLRLWSEGPHSKSHIWTEFQSALGTDNGRAALKSFENLCTMCSRYGRRPMMRHHSTCKMIGADESCFANLVALAADGEREDAMLISTLLVRADIAPGIAALAAEEGLALKRMGLRDGHPANTTHEIPTHIH